MSFLTDPINAIADWLESLLLSLGLTSQAVTILMTLLGAIVVGSFGLMLVIFLIWVERKVYARIQDRLGPNRVGPWGILQTFPDMIKIFTKEYITPIGADKVPYNLAPILSVSAVLLAWAVIPFASTVVGSDINVGVLYIVAVGAIGTLGIILAGWSSNNKYALLGAFRTVAQMVSYEVPMVLALLIPVLLARSMGVNSIVQSQQVWYILLAPIAAFFFFITSIAETGRAPFDLLEAESEIIAGYQTEYSGLKFGMFFVGEFLHAFTISALTVTLFLGGWRGPWSEQVPLLGTAYFFIKTFIVYFIVLWVRISLPRLRIDQMLNFNWKFLTPIALVMLMATAVLEKILSTWLPTLRLTDSGVILIRTITHLGLNVLVAAGVIYLLRSYTIRREKVGQPRPLAVAPEPPASVLE
jgi:NADH-quinone oxidoreductase subunit H